MKPELLSYSYCVYVLCLVILLSIPSGLLEHQFGDRVPYYVKISPRLATFVLQIFRQRNEGRQLLYAIFNTGQKNQQGTIIFAK